MGYSPRLGPAVNLKAGLVTILPAKPSNVKLEEQIVEERFDLYSTKDKKAQRKM